MHEHQTRVALRACGRWWHPRRPRGARIDAAPSFKCRLLLSLAYGCGLRASEVVSLKVSDIDSAQMVIRIEQAKGRKDRYVMLSPELLDMLRQWWKAARPQG